MKQKKVRTAKKSKIPKILWKTFLILWLIIGIPTIIWIVYIFIKMDTAQGADVIALIILFATAIYLLAIYSVLSLLIFIIWLIIKIIKRTKKH